LDLIGPQADLVHERALRVRDDGLEPAVADVVSEAVVPAGERFLRVALWPRRKRDAPMQAPVLNGMDLAVDAAEEDPLAQHRHNLDVLDRVAGLRAHVGLHEVVTVERRVPVVAEAELGVNIDLPRLLPLLLPRLDRALLPLAEAASCAVPLLLDQLWIHRGSILHRHAAPFAPSTTTSFESRFSTRKHLSTIRACVSS